MLRETPAPEPGADEVLVEVRAVGVNPVDTYIRAGGQGYAPRLPYTPGMDGAGVVRAVGANVRDLSAGERVYLSGSVTGTYAELCLCLPSQVHPLPDALSFAEGAGVNVPYATAYRALFQRARLAPGQSLLVHGASGGVGLAAVQLAAAFGAIVYGTAGSEAGRKLVREQGAAEVFDHRDPRHFAQILAATGGCGIDVIAEMLANVSLGRDLEILAPRGQVVVIGNRGTVEINPRELMRRDAAVLGMSLMNLDDVDKCAIHAALAAGLSQGALRPVIQRELPLAQAPQAHRLVMEGDSLGKIVLIL